MLKLIPILLISACICSCSRNPVAEVPGHLRPGNSIDVANQAIGGGGGQSGLTLGYAPMIDWHAPNIPVMQDGVVDVLYGVPRESIDGEAMRSGHYIFVKVAEQSFTQAHRHNNRSLLNDAQAQQIQRPTQTPASSRLKDRSGLMSSGAHQGMPHTKATEGGKKVTFVEMNEANRSLNVLGSQELNNEEAQQLKRDGVKDMVKNFNKLYQQQQDMVKPQEKK